MSLSNDLFNHAIELAADSSRTPNDIQLRKAVSALYYALFHRINGTAAHLIAPNVSDDVNYRIQRWFDHAEMKKVCGRFCQSQLEQPLLGLVGPAVSPELKQVAQSFIALQEARHGADYNLGYKLTVDEVEQFVLQAAGAMSAWDKIATSAEANIFILSLLMWKNWEKDRP